MTSKKALILVDSDQGADRVAIAVGTETEMAQLAVKMLAQVLPGPTTLGDILTATNCGLATISLTEAIEVGTILRLTSGLYQPATP